MQNNFTYTELVYLFGHELVQKAGFFSTKDSHPSGEKLPAVPLAQMMCLMAVKFLSDNGYITYSVESKKVLGIFSKEIVTLNLLKEWDGVDGLEKKLMEYAKNDNSLHKVIYNFLGSDSPDPWGEIIRPTKNSLVSRGVINSEQKKTFILVSYNYSYGSFNSSDFKQEFAPLKVFLETSAKDKPWKNIQRTINIAIKLRQEQSDMDND